MSNRWLAQSFSSARRWIGIDITYLAIKPLQRRLRDHHPTDLSPYEIIGAPTDVQGAEALKEISPHQFEWWAVAARPPWPWARFTGETPVLRACGWP